MRNKKIWKKLWNLHTIYLSTKISYDTFLMTLPVMSELNHRGLTMDVFCPRCVNKMETVNHLYMEGDFAMKAWFRSTFGVHILNIIMCDFKD